MSEANPSVRPVLEDRLKFEAMLADLSSQFVNIELTSVDATINDALQRLGTFLEVDRAAVSQLADDHGTMVFTHYWSRVEAAGQFTAVDAGHLMPDGLRKLLNSEIFAFSTLDDLGSDSPDRHFHEGRGTKSAIAIPIAAAGRVIGALGFSVREHERRWDADVIRRLRVIADVIGNVLARLRADGHFRKMTADRMEFEAVISDVASGFVDLDSTSVDARIEDSQGRLVRALDLDRSALFEFNATGQLVLTHYWQREEFSLPMLERGAPTNLFPDVAARVRNGEVVAISSVKDLPDSPDRDHLQQIGSKATVSIPLTIAGRVVGVLTFGAMRAERLWPAELTTRLTLVARIFAGALARKRAETELRKTLDENARLRDRLIQENQYLQREAKAHDRTQEIAGHGAAIRRMLDAIDQVARTGATVLLLGETGTGKELVATAIHERSPRSARAMVRVNCAAIPSALVESELFGREKGAYTGALARQAGRFEVADGSTIFLDEIGELPADVQVKLLRVLQERQIERLGSSKPVQIDVRIIAATHRNLEEMVADGKFREDLYYRLNVFPINVPALRERPEDIPTLVWLFVDECAKALGKRIESISKEDMLALQKYSWPGNVRELRNVVERAVIIATGTRLAIEPPAMKVAGRGSLQLHDVERDHIRDVLRQTGWRVRGSAGAAELLGLKPSTLEDRIKKLGLRRPAS